MTQPCRYGRTQARPLHHRAFPCHLQRPAQTQPEQGRGQEKSTQAALTKRPPRPSHRKLRAGELGTHQIRAPTTRSGQLAHGSAHPDAGTVAPTTVGGGLDVRNSTTREGKAQGKNGRRGRRPHRRRPLRPCGIPAARSSGGETGRMVRDGLPRGRWGSARAIPGSGAGEERQWNGLDVV
jgi:hypothetical protein